MNGAALMNEPSKNNLLKICANPKLKHWETGSAPCPLKKQACFFEWLGFFIKCPWKSVNLTGYFGIVREISDVLRDILKKCAISSGLCAIFRKCARFPADCARYFKKSARIQTDHPMRNFNKRNKRIRGTETKVRFHESFILFRYFSIKVG